MAQSQDPCLSCSGAGCFGGFCALAMAAWTREVVDLAAIEVGNRRRPHEHRDGSHEYRTTMELADTRSSLSLDRDLHTFGVFNSDKSLVFQNYASLSSDSSSGYLQDAISEWVSPFKRRRMLFYPSDQPFDDTDKFLESCWNFDPLGDSLTGFNALSEDSLDSSIISIINGTTPPSSSTVKTEEEATPEQGSLSTPSSTSKSLLSNDAEISPPSEQGSSGSPEQRRKRLAYPFALVKPGATEEVLTLEEINARILRRPTRPVRHPIGEFACSPCVSPNGTGLSGKSVVAFTRVHTEGKGTITIIRTRG